MKYSISEKLKYWWTALYFPVYMLIFDYLEKHISSVKIISTRVDRLIPFIEAFVVPYLIWFPFIAIIALTFFFNDKEEYKNYFLALASGMTLFLIISAVFPNGLDIRPAYYDTTGIFGHMLSFIYSHDTSTNVMPSIHAYNSLVTIIAVDRSTKVFTSIRRKWLCHIISASIVLSTLFIKQHSILDVIAALALTVIADRLIYERAAISLKHKKAFRQQALH
ncbi:MAG: phosphoesterase [Lachnospiraceae bacterium]|nr:phosphoesterase [Lachnospiraceae bacterium]